MQTKFKRQQLVRLLRDPDPEFIEYHNPEDEENTDEHIPIEKGMHAKVNMILSNGQYHLVVLDGKGNTIAYCSVSEDDIEAI